MPWPWPCPGGWDVPGPGPAAPEEEVKTFCPCFSPATKTDGSLIDRRGYARMGWFASWVWITKYGWFLFGWVGQGGKNSLVAGPRV